MAIDLKRIDSENEEFYKEALENVLTGKMSIKDVLGFDLKTPRAYVAGAKCGVQGSMMEKHCSAIRGRELGFSNPIFALLPMYDTLVYPISPRYGGEVMTEAKFKDANDVSLGDFMRTIEAKRVIPYFPSSYSIYDPDLIRHFLESGLPRISASHMDLIRIKDVCKLFDGNCEECNKSHVEAPENLSQLGLAKYCSTCLSLAKAIKISEQDLSKTRSPKQALCGVQEALAARNLDSVLQISCPLGTETLGLFKSAPTLERQIEPIVKGLKVAYTPDIDFQSYLDILDSSTTKAVRKLTAKLLQDPYAARYSERLSNKIYEFNREIDEIAKTKTAKFYHAVSDIAVYGGSKFIERQTDGLIRSKKKDLGKISEWIASKLMDVHAKATGKDWAFAQMHRFRCKLEQCKANS